MGDGNGTQGDSSRHAAGSRTDAHAVLASARTTGKESIKGTIVASGASGSRRVVSSLIVALGAFSGTGRDVEVPNRPGDPQNVTRDNLIFRQGTMHLLGISNPPKVSMNG